MNKEQFIKAIEAIEKQNTHDIEVSEHLALAFPDAFQANLMPNHHHLSNILFEILQTSMGDTFDKYGQSCIEYFCWELDFGRKNDTLKIYDASGKELPLSNASELWEFLNNELNQN